MGAGNNVESLKQLKTMLVLAMILMGLLAGETFDRLVIGFRAWHYVDIASWAMYSRHADLGNGKFVYPLEAVGGAILLIICSVMLIKRRKENFVFNFLQIHLATIFSVIGLLLTFSAGPFMLSIRHINDPALLQNAFDNFYFWSAIRGTAHILSFVLLITGSFSLFNRSETIPTST